MDNFWTTFFYVLVMVAVLVAVYFVTKYISKKGGRFKSRYIRMIDCIMVGRDKHVALIEVGDKTLLIGITNQSIQTLADINGETIKSCSDAAQEPSPKGFFSMIQNYIEKMKKAPGDLNKARMQAKAARGAEHAKGDCLSQMDEAVNKRKNEMDGRNKT